jgi:hypothetical protein
MSPVQFMARLAALVPPPRSPLIRFHGVFAPHSSWRSSVVPSATATRAESDTHTHGIDHVDSATEPSNAEAANALVRATAPRSDPPEPDRRRAPWRLDWATLLKRVYDVDALACPCGGRLKFIAVVTEEETAKTMLESMGLPSAPPPIARARAPDAELIDEPPPDWD